MAVVVDDPNFQCGERGGGGFPSFTVVLRSDIRLSESAAKMIIQEPLAAIPSFRCLLPFPSHFETFPSPIPSFSPKPFSRLPYPFY